MARKIKYHKSMMEDIVSSSSSVRECIIKMGLEPTNGTNTIFYKQKKRYDLDTSHFNDIKKHVIRSNEDLFKINGKADRSTVRKRILKENIIPYICQECGQDENWRGKKMPLILDHINGINNDNRLENLRFLCSNCDSIQETYKNRNTNESREKKKIKKELLEKSNQLEKKKKKKKLIEDRKNRILEANIDFSKKTWGVEVSKIIDKSPSYSLKWVKTYMSEYIQ